MLITLDGIVTAERKFGEYDKFIDILTAEYGTVEICVKGARKITGKNVSSTQLFSYSNFCFSERNDRYYLNSSEPIKIFYDLRLDIKNLSLGVYFAEISKYSVMAKQSAREIMRLLLNTLDFLSRGAKSREFLKSVFEMRFMSEIGHIPQLIGCRSCYVHESDEMYFLIDRGVLLCGGHFEEGGYIESEYNVRVSRGALQALRFICLSDMSRLFNFKVTEETQKTLNSIAEKYLIYHMGKSFKSLEYYKNLDF